MNARPRRMAVVTTAHPWGDPRVFERELAACLEWGVETHVFVTLDGLPPASEWCPHPRLVVHPLPVPRGRLARFRLALGVWRQVLRHGPFPLVHFHDPELVPAMALLALARPESYTLYDIHEDLPLQLESKQYLRPALRRPVSRLAGAMLQSARDLFSGFAPATEAVARAWPGDRTRVVHNYPKALFSLPDARERPLDPRRVLYVGGLSRVRGTVLAVQAVREARRVVPDLGLEFIGWVMDPESAQAIREAQAEGWCTHVERLAPRALMERAAGAGVGLVTLLPRPNYVEALPTKLFEYMAMGIPVLASDFPLWRRLVEEAGAGRVAEPCPGPVAQALAQMIADPGQLRRYAQAGRAAYCERYRWEVEAANLHWHLRRAFAS